MHVLGIHVAELSIDGIYTIDSYLNHTEGIGPKNLTDFSLCLRYNIYHLRPIINAMVSYSTWTSDNSLLLIFIKKSDGSLMLRGCKCGYCSVEQVSNLLQRYNNKRSKGILFKKVCCIKVYFDIVFKFILGLCIPQNE